MDAKRTKAALKKAGATYSDVARASGVTWRMVSYVIHGQRKSANVEKWIATITGAIK